MANQYKTPVNFRKHYTKDIKKERSYFKALNRLNSEGVNVEQPG